MIKNTENPQNIQNSQTEKHAEDAKIKSKQPNSKIADKQRSYRRAKPMQAARILDDTLDRALKAQGFMASEIVKRWGDIVGVELALVSVPLRLSFPRGVGQARLGGCLTIRIEGAFAPLMQHHIPVVQERINAHFGFAAIGKIALQQGPLPHKPRKHKIIKPLQDLERQSLEALVAPVKEQGLREALARLGAAILGGEALKGNKNLKPPKE